MLISEATSASAQVMALFAIKVATVTRTMPKCNRAVMLLSSISSTSSSNATFYYIKKIEELGHEATHWRPLYRRYTYKITYTVLPHIYYFGDMVLKKRSSKNSQFSHSPPTKVPECLVYQIGVLWKGRPPQFVLHLKSAKL